MEQIKGDCGDARGRWIGDFGKDLRYAARAMRRSPGFLAVSVLSLALGIGANTAIFTLIDAVMLRPLPVPSAERLTYITRIAPNGNTLNVSYPLFQYFRANMKSVPSAAIEMQSTPAIVIDGAEEIVDAELVTGEHFATVGVAPAAGRLLQAGDDAISPESPAAVISYRYWKRRFGLSPAAVGKTFTVRIKNRVFTIVGVTPADYHGTRVGRDPDLTLPLTMMIAEGTRTGPTNNQFDMLGRLAPGATVRQANAEVQVLWHGFQARIAAQMSQKNRTQYFATHAVALAGAHGLDRLGTTYSEALFVLMGIVMLVLLLACANLSGLLLARAASRQREISIRLAIGASGGRLFRQFLTESLALAALGGAAGLLLARWFSATLVRMMVGGDGLNIPTTPDWRVLWFTAAVSVLACLLCGLAPGLHAVRSNLNPALGQAPTGARQRLGKTLLVAQIAISTVLVTGASLFTTTLANLYGVDRGIRTDGVLAFRVRTGEQYSPERAWTSTDAVLRRLNEAPGVTAVTMVDVLPISGGLWDRDVQVEGYTLQSSENNTAGFNAIGPKYFATMQTPMLAGREFDARDGPQSAKVAIVNEEFARQYFGGRPAIGRRIHSGDTTYEIVGVARNAKYASLRDPVMRTVYIACTQRDAQPSNYWFLARVAAGNPMNFAAGIEKAVRDADAEFRVRVARPYSEIVDQTMATERMMATLGGFFGVLALMVACLGIFGVMAFQVSRRISEIGLRMALGASRRSIASMVMRDVALLLAIGYAIGAAAALPLAGITRTMLFGVTPRDPGMLAVTATVLCASAVAAAWLPARRASRVDPMIALRHE